MATKSLNIGYDLDDVVIGSASQILENYNKNHGTGLELHNYYSRDPELWGVTDMEVAIGRVNDFLVSEAFFALEPIPGAAEAINQLAKLHTQHVITGRPSFIQEQTVAYLERHMPQAFKTTNFTDFYGNGNVVRDKGLICKDLAVDVMIEDHLHHALAVAGQGIPVILFGSYPWNQSTDLPPNVRRALDWEQVKEMLQDYESRS